MKLLATRRLLAAAWTVGLAACGSSNTTPTVDAPMTMTADAPIPDAFIPPPPDAILHPRDAATNVPTAKTNIEHVILIVQENHTFDNYFGTWCTAATGSAPTCTQGPACCEAMPAKDPSGASPTILTDVENASYSPDHDQACEILEINGGANDRFATGTSCADPRNFAVAPPDLLHTYIGYANTYALADRYFQSVAGASASNDQYLAVAKFVFLDNVYEANAVSHQCASSSPTKSYTGQTTIVDLLRSGGFNAVSYGEGWGAAVAANPLCAPAPDDCPLHVPIYPCEFDPDDVPFEFYSQLTDNHDVMADLADLFNDLSTGNLPNFAFVKGIGYHSEHPSLGITISDGEAFVDSVVQAVLASPTYKNNTLILLTWDESGGFYDHVPPPPASTVDQQPYGVRIPLLAIGHFAAPGTVSHVQMEHSSIVKFLEFNFLGAVGQLSARDAVVNNIGSLLDSSTTGTTVPSN